MERIFELLSMPPSYFIGVEYVDAVLAIALISGVVGVIYKAVKNGH